MRSSKEQARRGDLMVGYKENAVEYFTIACDSYNKMVDTIDTLRKVVQQRCDERNQAISDCVQKWSDLQIAEAIAREHCKLIDQLREENEANNLLIGSLESGEVLKLATKEIAKLKKELAEANTHIVAILSTVVFGSVFSLPAKVITPYDIQEACERRIRE